MLRIALFDRKAVEKKSVRAAQLLRIFFLKLHATYMRVERRGPDGVRLLCLNSHSCCAVWKQQREATEAKTTLAVE